MSHKQHVFLLTLFFIIFAPLFFFSSTLSTLTSAANDVALYGWAWSGDNMGVTAETDSSQFGGVGWISFSSRNCDSELDGILDTICGGNGTPNSAGQEYGVKVRGSQLWGEAWATNLGRMSSVDGGWITFGPEPNAAGDTKRTAMATSLDPDDPTEVSWAYLSGNNLKGWARACAVFATGCDGALKPDAQRGGWDGWIKLSGKTTTGATYGVVRSSFPGGFVYDCNGAKCYVWGGASSPASDNPNEQILGWINFNPISSGEPFCGNNVKDLGEDCKNCPTDYGACPPIITCPNGVKDPGENCSNCPADYGECPLCPNGVKDPGENCTNCPEDYGVCPPLCGNGIKDGGDENCLTCPADYGVCPLCGNGAKDPGETCSNCPADYGSCHGSNCNNGAIDAGEDCTTCPDDIKFVNGENACDVGCGNHSCSEGETCSSCAIDCGACGGGGGGGGGTCPDGTAYANPSGVFQGTYDPCPIAVGDCYPVNSANERQTIIDLKNGSEYYWKAVPSGATTYQYSWSSDASGNNQKSEKISPIMAGSPVKATVTINDGTKYSLPKICNPVQVVDSTQHIGSVDMYVNDSNGRNAMNFPIDVKFDAALLEYTIHDLKAVLENTSLAPDLCGGIVNNIKISGVTRPDGGSVLFAGANSGITMNPASVSVRPGQTSGLFNLTLKGKTTNWNKPGIYTVILDGMSNLTDCETAPGEIVRATIKIKIGQAGGEYIEL